MEVYNKNEERTDVRVDEYRRRMKRSFSSMIKMSIGVALLPEITMMTVRAAKMARAAARQARPSGMMFLMTASQMMNYRTDYAFVTRARSAT